MTRRLRGRDAEAELVVMLRDLPWVLDMNLLVTLKVHACDRFIQVVPGAEILSGTLICSVSMFSSSLENTGKYLQNTC